MASYCDYEKCYVCGSEDSLYTELDCNTQEEYCFCSKCGYHYHYKFKRDDMDKIIRKPKKYHKNACFFTIKSYETGEIIWKKSMKEIEALTEELLLDWMNKKCSFDEELPKGKHSIHTKQYGELKQIIYIGDRIDTCFEGKGVLVFKAKVDEMEKFGGGVIVVDHKTSGLQEYIVIEPGTTKEEMIKHMKDYRRDYMYDTFSLHGTWFNEKEKKIEEIEL